VFTEVLPVQGSDLMLTLDPDLQLAAERALAEAVEQTHAKGGMVVALDARNGEILAMASAPTFDPNDLGSFNVDETRNRTVTDAFEPGSVNKIVTASAALNEGLITATDRMWVPDRIVIADKEFKEKGGARDLDLRGILAQSSNLGTIRIAQKVGHHRLNTYLERFGYGRSTGLGFPGESAGSVPKAGQWATQLPTMAIGQSLSVTILQLTRAYATIANDGVDIEPRLVSGWVDPKGRPHAPPASRQRRVVEADVARTLRDLLRSVVSEGTAQRAAVPGFEVAGKTGTAQKPFPGGYRGHVSSFVGMVPASKPDIVIGVTLDDPVPVEAGLVAAPVFAQVAKVAVRILHIAPAPPAPEPRPLSGDGHPVDG
jgi:cell division protein FtsI (penicillin-binding protein 3)